MKKKELLNESWWPLLLAGFLGYQAKKAQIDKSRGGFGANKKKGLLGGGDSSESGGRKKGLLGGGTDDSGRKKGLLGGGDQEKVSAETSANFCLDPNNEGKLVPGLEQFGNFVCKNGAAINLGADKKSETPKEKLAISGYKSCGNILKRKCKGINVKQLQNKLISCGFPLPKKGEDGIFGSETYNAVKDFQKSVGIKVDGVVGPETQQYLSNCKSVAPKEVMSTTSENPYNLPPPPKPSGGMGYSIGNPFPSANEFRRWMKSADAMLGSKTVYYKSEAGGIIKATIDNGELQDTELLNQVISSDDGIISSLSETYNFSKNRYNELEKLVLKRLVK